MFIRFVVGAESEDARWLNGVFAGARRLADEGTLYAHEAALLDETFAWFNEYLPCPPFGAKLRSGEWTPDAVAWFRDDARAFVRRIWDLVALLRENGASVRLLRDARPGRIVYEDRYQVVAETFRRG
jgi:hypothetical protein